MNKNNTAHTGYLEGKNPPNNQCKRTTHIPYCTRIDQIQFEGIKAKRFP